MASQILICFVFDRYPLTLTANVLQSSRSPKEFYGNLILRDKEFKVHGYANMVGKIPVDVQITLTPQDGSDSLHFEYKFETKETGNYALTGSVQYADKFAKCEANIISLHKYDWQLKMEV